MGAALVSVIVQNEGGGGRGQSTPPPAAPTATAPEKATPPQPAPQPPGEGLAIGIGETPATLLWSRAAQPDLPAGMGPWRDRLTALHPRYFRLTVDWARIQPDPSQPPNWTMPDDGCAGSGWIRAQSTVSRK